MCKKRKAITLKINRKRAAGNKDQAAADFLDDNEPTSEEEVGEAEELAEATQSDLEGFDMEESEINPSVKVPSRGVEIIMDLNDWLRTPWDKAN